LIVSWLLLTFVVANTYKGVLFTILTTPSFPKVPQTLHEVLQSNYSVWTTNRDLHRFFKRFDIERKLTTTDDERLNKYRKLNEMLELIICTPSKLFVAMNTRNELKGLYRNHSISEKLMILDPEEDVRLLKEFYSLFSQDNFVLGDTLNFFTERYQWIIRRNAFLSSFLPILSGLMESGIYSR